MPYSNELADFDRLGIDLNSSQMIVLKALMGAAGGTSKAVSYKEIANYLENMQKKKYSKAYIYRQLTELEKEGYVTAHQEIGQVRNYQISEAEIRKMLKEKREEALSALEEKKDEYSKRRKLLQSVNPENVAFSVFNQLMGLEPVKGSLIIEGQENVRSTIIREFGETAKPGDILRIIAPASLLTPGGLKQVGAAELSLIRRAVDGVKIVGLLMPAEGKITFTKELIDRYVSTIADTFTKLFSTGNISFRIAKKNYKTYRMVSLNSDKMLLYLTHAAESDMAALVQYKDNPGLIDDAIKTFDTIFEEATATF
jgi:DNA-binding PadR family transcriptional regulator